jgi:uncharacterized membrane protein
MLNFLTLHLYIIIGFIVFVGSIISFSIDEYQQGNAEAIIDQMFAIILISFIFAIMWIFVLGFLIIIAGGFLISIILNYLLKTFVFKKKKNL